MNKRYRPQTQKQPRRVSRVWLAMLGNGIALSAQSASIMRPLTSVTPSPPSLPPRTSRRLSSPALSSSPPPSQTKTLLFSQFKTERERLEVVEETVEGGEVFIRE